MKQLAYTILASIFLAACGDQPRSSNVTGEKATEIHDVAWYLEHAAEHDKAKQRCKTNPGALRNAPECVNADQAQRQIFVWGHEEALRRAREGR